MASRPGRRWKRWLFGALALSIVGAGMLLPVGDLATQATAWIAGLGPIGLVAYVGLFVVWGMVLPKGPLVAFAGAAFGLVEGLLIVYLGATLAMTCGFWLARRFGRTHAHGWLARHPWAAACDRALATRGARLVLLLRLSPVIPGHLQNYIYGLSRVPFATCVLASWIGTLPYTALLVGGGALVGAGTEGMGGWTWVLAIAGLCATAVAGWMVVRAARSELRAAGVVAAS
jgi:uncharacterized membrane protein YdjX (TVP38/TMEM64 family)